MLNSGIKPSKPCIQEVTFLSHFAIAPEGSACLFLPVVNLSWSNQSLNRFPYVGHSNLYRYLLEIVATTRQQLPVCWSSLFSFSLPLMFFQADPCSLMNFLFMGLLVWVKTVETWRVDRRPFCHE